jgi:ABC-type dipeptide/oligopeptide/nickel transport system permease subunit
MSATPFLRKTLIAIGWSGLGMVAVAVVLSDFLARAPAGAPHIGAILSAPSPQFLFGTDQLGRDILSEMLHALSVTAVRALPAAFLAIAAGSVFGFVAARMPAPIRLPTRWAMGVFAAIPALLLAILLIGVTDRDYATAAAGLAAAPLAFVRVFDRARVSANSAHAAYARATGIAPSVLLRRDLAYEVRDTLLESAARAFAAVTIILSTVSFLGFGAVPPHRDLGLMVAAAKPVYVQAWWTAAFPALALLMLVFLARLAAGLDEGERA